MNIQTDRALLPANRQATRHLVVDISAPDPGRRPDRPPVNVAFVLDRSGSMDGRKIEMARKAVEHAIRLLDARDRLAIVVYDNIVDTLLASTPATDEAKALALRRLRKVDARGSTNLAGGWLRGADEVAAEVAVDDATAGDERTPAIRRVLLLSDGLANQGLTDRDELARTAADLRARGVSTSTFGVGADFDEVLMARLASEGGGHFYFIEQPGQIPDFLTSELGDTLEIVARDAQLVVDGGPGVSISTLNDMPVEVRPDGLHVKLGDLVAGQLMTIALAIDWSARGIGDAATVNVRLADRDAALFPVPMPIDWQVVDIDADAGQPVNIDVLVVVARLIAEQARAEALEANRRRDTAAARALVTTAANRIRDLAAGASEVTRIADELDAQEVCYSVVMDQMTIKRMHFASRNARTNRGRTGAARRTRPQPSSS